MGNSGWWGYFWYTPPLSENFSKIHPSKFWSFPMTGYMLAQL